jgi:hypothetical protein
MSEDLSTAQKLLPTAAEQDCRRAPDSGAGQSALAAQLLHAYSDRSKIVCGAGLPVLAAQLLEACPDRRKIVSYAGSGHISSVFL